MKSQTVEIVLEQDEEESILNQDFRRSSEGSNNIKLVSNNIQVIEETDQDKN